MSGLSPRSTSSATSAAAGMLLAFGLVCGILEARSSGLGQVIDAAMLDGTVALTTFIHGMMAMGAWQRRAGDQPARLRRSTSTRSTSAPTGSSSRSAPSSPSSTPSCCAGPGLTDDPDFAGSSMDASTWPRRKERLAEVFRTRTRDEWATVFDGTDACVAPVLTLSEAPYHPHNVARETFVELDGIVQPAPAPRFSRTEAGCRPAARALRSAHRRGAQRVGRRRRTHELQALRDQGAIA